MSLPWLAIFMRTPDAFYAEIDDLCLDMGTMAGPAGGVAAEIVGWVEQELARRGDVVEAAEMAALQDAAAKFVSHNYIEVPGEIQTQAVRGAGATNKPNKDPQVATKTVNVAERSVEAFYAEIDSMGLHVQIMTGAPAAVADRIVGRVVAARENLGPSSAIRDEDLPALQEAATQFVAHNYVEKQFQKKHVDLPAPPPPAPARIEQLREWIGLHPKLSMAFSILVSIVTLAGVAIRADHAERAALTSAISIDASEVNKQAASIFEMADAIKRDGLYVQSPEITARLIEAAVAIGELRAGEALDFKGGSLSRDEIAAAQKAITERRQTLAKIEPVTNGLYFQRKADAQYRAIDKDPALAAIINESKILTEKKKQILADLEAWRGWSASLNIRVMEDKIANDAPRLKIKAESQLLLEKLKADPFVVEALNLTDWTMEKMEAAMADDNAAEADLRSLHSILMQISRSINDDLEAVRMPDGKISVVNTAGEKSAALLIKRGGKAAGLYSEAEISGAGGSSAQVAADGGGVVARKPAGSARFVLVDGAATAILVAP